MTDRAKAIERAYNFIRRNLRDSDAGSWREAETMEFTDDMVDFSAQENADIIAEKDRWRLALESLTAGGSEFVNDLDYCMAYIQKQRLHSHEIIKAKVKENRAIIAENERLKAEAKRFEEYIGERAIAKDPTEKP